MHVVYLVNFDDSDVPTVLSVLLLSTGGSEALPIGGVSVRLVVVVCGRAVAVIDTLGIA